MDGDGTGDVRYGASWLAGPLAVEPDAWPGGAPLFSSPPLDDIEPVGLDLDGDRRADFRHALGEAPGTPRGLEPAPPARTWGYLTAHPGGGIWSGASVVRVVADEAPDYVTAHVPLDGAALVAWWHDGDEVVLIRVSGAP